MTLREGEGYIPVTGGRVWYQIVGSGDAVPLLCLHGGPGIPHDYLETLADLADERPVIFYDQLGCGNSERPDDITLWITERFVEELGQVRQALGLNRLHVLGQSWGTMLLVDYVLTRPQGVQSIILASPCTSIPMWLQDAKKWRSQMPADVQEAMDRNEACGTTDSPEYTWATNEYYKRHLCRLDPWPMAMERAMVKAGLPVYHTMWGPSEFNMTVGNLRYYDRTQRLYEITTPTLWTCGRYDEAIPETVSYYQSLLPGSELAVFENSSHTPHLEERDAYMKVMRNFLKVVEGKQ